MCIRSFSADPSGRAVLDMGLRPFACWDCGYEFRQGHGCLSVVCRQVEVSAMGGSLVQRSPTECSVFECGLETSIMRLSRRKAIEPWVVGEEVQVNDDVQLQQTKN